MVSGSVTPDGFVPNPPYDGSHALGIDYVPFDGYRALLHRGEAVLTADQNRGRMGQTMLQPVTRVYQTVVDGQVIEERVEKVIEAQFDDAINWGVTV